MSARFASDQPSGLSNHIKNVAIVGATGRIGTHITRTLLATGAHKITALTRPSSSPLPADVTRKEIDYTVPSTLTSALQNQDFLIISLSATAPRDAQTKLIAAAAEAGVKWIMPSEYGTDVAARPDVGQDILLGPGMLAARKQIVDAGMSFVGVACGPWYEFSLSEGERSFGFELKQRRVTFYDRGETKITTSTWPLCGEAVAKLLSLPILPEGASDEQPTLSRWRNQSLRIGSFFISQREMFDSVLRVTGTKEEDWEVQYEDVGERYERAMKGVREGNMALFGVMLYARVMRGDGASDLEQGKANAVLGLGEESLDKMTKVAVAMAKEKQ
ncbi:hypothetical protein B0A48_04498 [Cryoendolithus antarcticus]|uniref:NAD(P)-binding domain-containing protein n=1 Tax=Cryoendolithus antarcticus TaxID=1507870 RepID=A0A1V8TFX9_9PEZI|nr:hypothetical protein B0A48_04498 [Cryoendolithus antarcticus]